MNPAIARIFIRTTPTIVLLLLAACGGYNPDQKGGNLNTADWLEGDFEGYSILYDRNGNVKESGTIKRACRKMELLRYHCVEKTLFSTTPETIDDTIDYLIDYDAGEHSVSVSISFKGGGELEGKIHKMSAFFTGRKEIPFESKKDSAVNLRVNAFPGGGGPIVERYTYSFLGVEIGDQENILFRKDKE